MKASGNNVHRWKKAFPLSDFKPALEPPTEAEHRLAQQFCPALYTDSAFIKEGFE